MVSNTSFHRGGYAQRRMYAAEVVVKEIERNLMCVVLKLLAESIRQPSVAPHPHPHRKIAALHEGCADVLRIRRAAEYASATPNACRRAVARLRAVARRSIQFNQHRVVNIGTKGIFHGIGINAVPIRGQLNPGTDSGRDILHESVCRSCSSISERIGHDQFGIRVNCGPSPHIARALLHLLKCDVLLLSVDERPNLVTLDATHAKVADMGLMISSADTSQIVQESQHGMFADAKHPAGRIDGVSLDQCTHDLTSLAYRKLIHDHSNIRYRSRISQEQNVLDFVTAHVYDNGMAKKRKNPYAVALGRKGGKKGGPARAANMTPEERSESARNAVLARWAKTKNDGRI